jgi:hypothetical protein
MTRPETEARHCQKDFAICGIESKGIVVRVISSTGEPRGHFYASAKYVIGEDVITLGDGGGYV